MREITWVGSSLEDLSEFPEDVKDEIGYALLIGIGGVMEIISDFDKNTYRAVYAVKIGEIIYVLHCFQKKSKHGIATPKQEIELIKKRLQTARQIEVKREK